MSEWCSRLASNVCTLLWHTPRYSRTNAGTILISMHSNCNFAPLPFEQYPQWAPSTPSQSTEVKPRRGLNQLIDGFSSDGDGRRWLRAASTPIALRFVECQISAEAVFSDLSAFGPGPSSLIGSVSGLIINDPRPRSCAITDKNHKYQNMQCINLT